MKPDANSDVREREKYSGDALIDIEIRSRIAEEKIKDDEGEVREREKVKYMANTPPVENLIG